MLGESVIEQKRTASLPWLRLSPASLGLAAVGLLATDWGSRLAGNSLVPGAPLDETAHLLTATLVLWALYPLASTRFVVPALLASVAIDADHVPGELGANWLTAGTPRPYTHSLLSVTLVLATALACRRRRVLMLGVAFGLALHLWRDVSETGNGVALFWPFSDRSVRLSHADYLTVMALAVAAGASRLWAQQR